MLRFSSHTFRLHLFPTERRAAVGFVPRFCILAEGGEPNHTNVGSSLNNGAAWDFSTVTSFRFHCLGCGYRTLVWFNRVNNFQSGAAATVPPSVFFSIDLPTMNRDGAAIWTTTTSMPKTDAASSPYYIITGPSRQFFSYIQSFNVSNWSAGRPAGAGLPCVFRTESIMFCRVGKPAGRGTERYKTRQLNNMADCRSAPFVRNRSRSEISFPGMRLNV